MAFWEADVVMFIGTRFNSVISHSQAPRFNPDARVIQVNIDPGRRIGMPSSVRQPEAEAWSMATRFGLLATRLPASLPLAPGPPWRYPV